MNIEVHVVPGARKREVRRDASGLRVRLVARPVEGKANEELIEVLAGTFGVRKREIAILSGERGRKKVVSIPIGQADLDALPGDGGEGTQEG